MACLGPERFLSCVTSNLSGLGQLLEVDASLKLTEGRCQGRKKPRLAIANIVILPGAHMVHGQWHTYKCLSLRRQIVDVKEAVSTIRRPGVFIQYMNWSILMFSHAHLMIFDVIFHYRSTVPIFGYSHWCDKYGCRPSLTTNISDASVAPSPTRSILRFTATQICCWGAS